jgi:hypothetical protein
MQRKKTKCEEHAERLTILELETRHVKELVIEIKESVDKLNDVLLDASDDRSIYTRLRKIETFKKITLGALISAASIGAGIVGRLIFHLLTNK